jgi:KUP system potassium uptake protein
MNVNKNSTSSEPHKPRTYSLALLALGVVFGDIGTSPLYAFRECFSSQHNLRVTDENVLGVLSLIFWSLIIVISIKYLAFVLRADNEGEGGILALLTLVVPQRKVRPSQGSVLLVIGLFGAALFYGDGMLTPAISVLSAIEGLKVGTSIFDPYVIPITVGILVALFLFQKRGTGGVGKVFGPITLLWFITLALLGTIEIIKVPEVLGAINPLHAVEFFANNSYRGFVVLGAVFLVVTGGEALYADIGHFGKQPIRLAWFVLVLPSLLLNYFGQGALLISKPETIRNPFYLLAPSWGLYPLIGLATAATIIASQAVISGAFSITRQAIQLGYLPRLEVRHTSPEEIGQVYTPSMNWILLVATVGLVLGFRSSENLAGAYGVAISALMVVTAILMFVYARTHLGWSILTAVSVTTFFLVIDIAFFGANMLKLRQGAWFPLLVGAVIYFLMTTWNQGRAILREQFQREEVPIETLLADLDNSNSVSQVPGTAVFMVSNPRGIPQALLHNIKHNKVIHERVILLTIVTEEVPRVSRSKRLEIKEITPNFIRIIAHIGFMENANVPAILRLAEVDYKIEFNLMETTFFLGRETLILGKSKKMSGWRKKLFALMSKNAQTPLVHFGIPPNRVIEIGTEVEI